MKRITAVIFILFFTSFARAETLENWPKAKALAQILYNRETCDKMWDILWPWAKKGNVEARSMLAKNILLAGMWPPGSTSDMLSYIRHATIFAIHGLANHEVAGKKLLPFADRIQGAELFSVILIYDACIDQKKTSEVCTNEMIQSGFIPDFESYSREIDAAVMAGLKPARCSCDFAISVMLTDCHRRQN